MIGERFVRFAKEAPPRTMPRLNNFVSFLQRKTTDAIMRASHITPNGYGSRLLVDIIKLADLDVLLKKDTDQYRLPSYLLSITKDLEKPIDVRQGKHTTNQLFIHSRQPCFELLTPSRRLSPLAEIPFDQPYSNARWDTIQPLRIADMGTTDLRFQVYNDQLSYQHHGPTHVVYSLDCLALVAKFVSYYQAQSSVPNLDQCLLNFVHSEIIVPSLLKDSLALWLRNIYRQQLLSASPLESHTSTIWDVVNIDTLGSDFSAAMIDINHLKTDLKNQSISSQTAMSSLVLGINGESFTSYYKNLYYTSTLPTEQPYAWVECLKNLSWWEFILMVSSFTPDYPDVISLQRDIIRDIRFWLMFKPWNEVHGSIPYKTMIRSRLEGMYTYLQGG
jgi:hypothetical protein